MACYGDSFTLIFTWNEEYSTDLCYSGNLCLKYKHHRPVDVSSLELRLSQLLSNIATHSIGTIFSSVGVVQFESLPVYSEMYLEFISWSI
jgi:hypothetical protein